MTVILTIAYLFLAGLCALIADKRGRNGGKFFLKLVGGTALLTAIAFWALVGSQDAGGAIWAVAYICLALGFLLAIFNPGTKDLAVATGEHGDYRKCPYCAEPVRKEAVKCKHCHSELFHP